MPTIPLTAAPLLFQIAAVLLGAPSFVLLITYLVVRFRPRPTPSASIASSVPNPDAILMILSAMERSLGAATGLIGGLGRVVLAGLAILAAAGLALALGLWWTGRGLEAGASWARPVAMVLTCGVVALSGLAAVSRIGWWRLVPCGVGALAIALLSTLWSG
jgi:hypothetical protein